jgi:FMN-binding domain
MKTTAPWLVLAGTVAGFLGVFGLHGSGTTKALVAVGDQASSPGRGGAAAGPLASASGAASSAAPVAGPRAVRPTATRSVPGVSEQYGYGELTASVTVSGGHITDVKVPAIRAAEQYSQQLASQVIPMLRNEVLAAQSANISAVSGATYTSQAYALSVQAALDKAHFK